MKRPDPVLDRRGRPIHLIDPYMEREMVRNYGERFGKAPWFSPQQQEQMYCAALDTAEIVCNVSGFPDPNIMWWCKGAELDTKSPSSKFKCVLFVSCA
jgi:hypothetical protein